MKYENIQITSHGIHGTNWLIDDESWTHPTLGGLISTRESSADFGLVDEDAPDFDTYWTVSAVADGSSPSITERYIVKRIQWVKQFGMNHIVINGMCSRNVEDTGAGAIHTSRIYLSIAGEGSNHITVTNSADEEFELKLDVSGLSVGTSYEVRFELYAQISGGVSGTPNVGSETSTIVRGAIEIRDSTETI